jgi:5-(carboxyamino)imidazole ribonucleotide mutase
MSEVLVLMGSKSDEKISQKVGSTLDEFGVKYSVEVASAHRNPEKVEKLITESAADVFITIAGLSAALPGVVASKTIKPVIGVPVESKLGGLDAVLSIVQMPPGIPVAAVGIDNGKNAALLAISILATKDEELKEKLENYRAEMKK